MNDAEGQQEPSMEEILASIRRIISEDGEGDAAAEAKAPQPAPKPAPAPEPEPEFPDDELVAEDLPEAPLDDDIQPVPSAEEEEVLELTDMVEDDGTVVDLSEARGGQPFLPEDAGEGLFDDGDEPVLSDHAAAAAAGSLAALTTAAGRRIADQLGTSDIGGLTLEQLVRELLRPMMREWLDQNLPPMVERMVRREIERVSKLRGL